MPLPSHGQLLAQVFRSALSNEYTTSYSGDRDIKELDKSQETSLVTWERKFHYGASYKPQASLGRKLVQALQDLPYASSEWRELCQRDFGISTDVDAAKNIYIGTFLSILVLDYDLHFIKTSSIRYGSLYSRASQTYDSSIIFATLLMLNSFDNYLWAQVYLYWMAMCTDAVYRKECEKVVAPNRIEAFKKNIKSSFQADPQQFNAVIPGGAMYILLMDDNLSYGQVLKIEAFIDSKQKLYPCNMNNAALANLLDCFYSHSAEPPEKESRFYFLTDATEALSTDRQNRANKLQESQNPTTVKQKYIERLYKTLLFNVTIEDLHKLASFAFKDEQQQALNYFRSLFDSDTPPCAWNSHLGFDKVYEKIHQLYSQAESVTNKHDAQVCIVLANLFNGKALFISSIDYEALEKEYRSLAKKLDPSATNGTHFLENLPLSHFNPDQQADSDTTEPQTRSLGL